jgi:hypothetical protein
MQRRHLLLIGGIIVLFGMAAFVLWQYRPAELPVVTTDSPIPVATATATSPGPVVTSVTNPTPYPTSLSVSVPFTSQAPNGTWDTVHEDLCEEASLLMAEWFALGKSGSAANGYKNQIAPATADQEMMTMYNWEAKHLSGSGSINADDTARIAREVLGLTDVTVLNNNISADSIKRFLASGKVIVVPAAGQQLNNPYFTAPGPPYHMLVVIGYNSKGFITNDPGTRHGEGYVYPVQTLMNAIHNWTGDNATISQGAPAILVIGKNS